jgi:hypothetical protein
MDGSFFQHFWDVVGGGLRLDPQVFVKAGDSVQDRWVTTAIILLAGLSQAIGQSIVLFANRVKPFRFILSLTMASLIYFATFFFWMLCIWFVVDVVFQGEFQVLSIGRTLTICYAPQILGFLIALPYFGMPISLKRALYP